MYRGTNPKFKFTLPFKVDELAEGYITVAQCDGIVVEKTLADCICDENVIICELSQAETLRFNHSIAAEFQLRVKKKSGVALASQIFRVDIERILKEGVI